MPTPFDPNAVLRSHNFTPSTEEKNVEPNPPIPEFLDVRPTGACGIYAIACKPTGKLYIGSSANIQRRWSYHRGLLRGTGYCTPHLRAAWNKYGGDAFLWGVIEICPREKLVEREQFYLDKFQAYDPEKGFNIRKIAESSLGVKHGEERRLKTASTKSTPEFKAAQSAAIKAALSRPEVREKMRDSSRAAKRRPEYMEKMLESTGSPEFRESQSRLTKEVRSRPEVKAKYDDPELKAKVAAKMTEGREKKWSDPEFRKNMSAVRSRAAKERWADPEYREKVIRGNTAARAAKLASEEK